jgi:hypothetical protein
VRLRCAALGLLLVAACSKRGPAPSEPSTLDARPSTTQVDQGLLVELRREAAARPSATPTVEDVLAALAAGKIAILRKQQVLAAPIGARYCVAAVSRAGLNMSICEFESAEAAKLGRDKSQQMWKAVPRRTLTLNAKTMLTTILVDDELKARTDREEAERRFRALTAK